MNMKSIISASKTTGLAIAGCVAAFIILAIQIAIFGEKSSGILLLDPIISGFLHTGISHFVFNMVLLFLLLIPAINGNYDIKKIFWITFFLSVAYLPVSVLGITQPAIGLSGTVYFLMVRWFFSWEKKKNLGIGIICSFLLFELTCMFDADGTAHGVHMLGALLGYISLNKNLILSKSPVWFSQRVIA